MTTCYSFAAIYTCSHCPMVVDHICGNGHDLFSVEGLGFEHARALMDHDQLACWEDSQGVEPFELLAVQFSTESTSPVTPVVSKKVPKSALCAMKLPAMGLGEIAGNCIVNMSSLEHQHVRVGIIGWGCKVSIVKTRSVLSICIDRITAHTIFAVGVFLNIATYFSEW